MLCLVSVGKAAGFIPIHASAVLFRVDSLLPFCLEINEYSALQMTVADVCRASAEREGALHLYVMEERRGR